MRGRPLVVLAVVAGALALLALLAVVRQRAAQPGRQFQVRQGDRVQAVILRRDTARVVLRRKRTGWQVNGRWPARPRAMKVLEKVLREIEVKSPVSGDLAARVLADPRARHTRVTVRGRLFPLKHFQIVRDTLLPGGNMMRLKGRKKKWYITWLPGEEVDPASLFVVDPYYWRDMTLFRFLPGEVYDVQVHYLGRDDGYRAGYDTLSGRVTFLPDDTALAGLPVDTARVMRYLTYFQHLECDEYDRLLPPAQQDSLLETPPLYSLTLAACRHRSFRMRVYPLLPDDPAKSRIITDVDVARAWVEPAREWVLIRYYRIDPLFLKAEEFITPTAGKEMNLLPENP